MRNHKMIFVSSLIVLGLAQDAFAQRGERRTDTRPSGSSDRPSRSSGSSSSGSSSSSSSPSRSSGSSYSGSSSSGSSSSSSSPSRSSGSSYSGSSTSSSTSREPRRPVSSSNGPAPRNQEPSRSSGSSTSTSTRPSRTSGSDTSTSTRPSRSTGTDTRTSSRPRTAPRERAPHNTGHTDSMPRRPVSSSNGPASRPRIPRSEIKDPKISGRPQHRAGRTHVRRTIFTHAPRVVYPHVVKYPSPRNYHVRVRTYYIYRSWIQEPVDFTYNDGYWDIDGYPYYVDNGYRYRYSSEDLCQYDLVDGEDYDVVSRTELQACSTAFDQCSMERDELNNEVQMDRFFCAESVDEDLRTSSGDDYFPYSQQMNETKIATIEAFLKGKSMKDLWKEGWYEGVGKCSIVKLRGNEHGCRWMIQVGTKVFPDPNGIVCSESSQAALIGCQEKDEKRNAGCILAKAVREGYCL